MKAIAHLHSTFSFDGKLTLQQLRDLMASRGVSVLFMSEHIEQLNADKINAFVEACATLSTEECVVVPGIEIDELHILIYGIGRVAAYDSVLAFAKSCHAAGALIAISHPVKVRKELLPEVLAMVEAVEIWNQRYDGRRAPRAVNIELFHRMKQRRATVVAMPGVDFHSTSDLSEVYMEMAGNAKERKALVDAVRSGCFTIMNGDAVVRIPEVGSSSGKAARAFATALRDTSTSVYRLAKRSGIRVPDRLRLMFKRAL